MTRLVYTKGKPDAKTRGCRDCFYCKKMESWWCTSTEASAEFNTIVPGRDGCPHWVPIESVKELKLLDRFFGDIIRVDLTKVMRR
jgi:hypothetical protein